MSKRIPSVEGKIENVTLASLGIDTTYQRGEKGNWRRIRAAFQPAAAGVLHVGRRGDGTLWLIDGQQRRKAMVSLGITTWKAFVVHSSGPAYEAGVFSLLNGRNRTRLTAAELFRAAVAGDDPVALAALRAVAHAGLTFQPVKGRRGWPGLACVGAIYRLTATHGEAVVSRGLALVAKTWPQQDLALGDVLPTAVIAMIAAEGDRVDDDRFVARLSVVPPGKILNDAALSIGHRHAAARRLIAGVYNKRLSPARRLKVWSEASGAA